jgi:hypothetical protein
MKNSINKIRITAIIVTLILITSTILLTTNNLVFAQAVEEGGSYRLPSGVTPDYEVQSTPYLSFRPNPVGLGQVFLINVWITPATHVSRYHTDFKVTITKPSGQQEVVMLDSYRADSTAWMEWLADEVGDWTIKFDFQGSYFPAGDYEVFGGSWIGPQIVTFDQSAYYKPASTGEQILTVQEDIVYSWPDEGLPTDYWTRPVNPEHREWWPILGYFPATGVTGGGDKWNELYPDTNIYNNPDYEFIPYVQAPNTAHIVWKRTENIGGLIGGVAGQTSWTSGGNTPSIIYAGRCYDSVTKVVDGETTSVWQCYDLRTGEVYWERDIETSAPNFIMYEEGEGEVPGSDPLYGRNIWLCRISGGNLNRYNPTTGALSQEISIDPLTSGTLYDGNKFLSIQNLDGNRRLIEWTIVNEQLSRLRLVAKMEVLRNITYEWTGFGDSQDYNVGIAVDFTSINQPALGAYTGTRVRAISLITGSELYDFEVPETMYSSSTAVADHGKAAFCGMDGKMHAYDLATGQKAWTSPAMDYPWSQPGFGSYDATSAYGMLFRQAYDGVYAFNWDDGSIAWHYKAPTPFEFETPYIDSEGNGVYSFNGASMVADGKLYTYNTEHTATQPITRGWAIHCIDVFTGDKIWSFAGGSGGQGGVADGYLTKSNPYSGETIVFGKGQSATTVSAPQTSIPKGTAVMITGTVLDQSPAQPNTPCVSKESMTLQMEYLHMQRPIDGIGHNEMMIGVPVTLTAMDSDGSYVDIGTTTTDGYYGTFGLAWTPPEEGTYEIIASFAGDDSYGSSAAAAYLVVGPEASSGGPIVPEPEPEPTPFITTEVAIIAAVAVAAVIGVVAFWVLKKRK